MAHKRYNLVDNGYLQLTNSISPSITTLNIYFPTTYTWNKPLPVDNWIGTLVKYGVDGNPVKMEKVYVTNTSGLALTVTRGYLGDGAQSFDADDYLFLNVVAENLNDINLRIDEEGARTDDLYLEGTHRLRVYRETADPALQVRIGAGAYNVGGAEGLYAGGTLTVANNVTTYVMIDSSGSIQTSTSTWNSNYVKLAIVVSSGGVITSITLWKADIYGGAGLINPTGSVVMWTTNTPPIGYLVCDGTAVSRTTYASLFSIISTGFGTGDGSTTFNLPNLKGRIPVGRDSGQTEFDTLAETGGAKTHTLIESEMPAHTHTYGIGTGGGGSPMANQTSDNTVDTTMTTSSTGGGSAHNNLQPYIVLNYIIKT